MLTGYNSESAIAVEKCAIAAALPHQNDTYPLRVDRTSIFIIMRRCPRISCPRVQRCSEEKTIFEVVRMFGIVRRALRTRYYGSRE